MGKIVNVVLNSNNAVSGTTQDAVYNVDWGAILKPNTPYRLHWCYVGQANTFTASTKLAQVQINFQMENYLNRSVSSGAPTTQFIGVLRSFYLNGTINYLHADDSFNPPIYLQNRPANNIFNVRILTNDATPVAWTDNAGTPVAPNAYILTLSFEEIDKQ